MSCLYLSDGFRGRLIEFQGRFATEGACAEYLFERRRLASAIGDSREPEHYARTRKCIRQAALDGQLRIRGRHEIESAGQDRTNFSDVYTEIPSAYWKHSIINALATGATCESDRHTKPETVYAWGLKGLQETNCYAGLQLNSDDVSQLVPHILGAK